MYDNNLTRAESKYLRSSISLALSHIDENCQEMYGYEETVWLLEAVLESLWMNEDITRPRAQEVGDDKEQS